MNPSPAPTSLHVSAAKPGNATGLLYDLAEVKATVEKHKGVKDYRKYIADVKAQNAAMAKERMRCHAQLRAIEKKMVSNAHKLGKYGSYLQTLYDQVFKQTLSQRVAEARKKLFES